MNRTSRHILIAILLVSLSFAVQRMELCAQYYPHPAVPIQNYFQPVKIRGPQGTAICLRSQNAALQFDEQSAKAHAFGLMVGQDYRLRITGIPFYPGVELFPSMTVLARTYPPRGLETEYPIQIDLTQQDLEMALSGQFVTRVIYLEDPRKAMPLRANGESPHDVQLSTDVEGAANPIDVAATYGQPVAILRLGGRVPKSLGHVDPAFFLSSAPWLAFENEPPENAAHDLHSLHEPHSLNTGAPPNTPQNTVTVDPALTEQGAAMMTAHATQHAQKVAGPPMEYLVDGGADGNVYVEEDWTVRNMRGEDTVAHFDTLDGQTLVEPSNRVHIYAPRFGAVRKVEGLVHSGQVTVLSAANNQWTLNEERLKESLGFTAQETQTGYARSRDQLGGVGGNKRSTGTSNQQGLGAYNNFDSVMLYSNALHQRAIGSAELVHLAKGSAGARAWQGAEGVKMGTNVLAPVAASSEEGAESFFQIEVNDSKTSKLRLIKVASKGDAQPGDMVEFTLRFDNVGDRVIGNVTILDNLTTRLEFLPGTAKSSLASGFLVQPNDSGSFTLRFEITDPLEPGQFGIVQFQCRVR